MAIMRYFLNMLPYMAAALPQYLAGRCLFLHTSSAKGAGNLWREAALLVFMLYLVGLASQTIIPKIQFGAHWLDIPERDYSTLNLVPFMIFKDSWNMFQTTGSILYFITNFFGNMVMFYPLGFFPAMVWPKKFTSIRSAALLGLVSSCFIEFCQLFLNRGTDIDDVLLNTCGVITGYALFLLFCRLFPKTAARFQ